MGGQNQHFLGAGNACLLLGLDHELGLESFTSAKLRTRESLRRSRLRLFWLNVARSTELRNQAVELLVQMRTLDLDALGEAGIAVEA